MHTGTEPAADARERARDLRRRAEARADERKQSIAREVHTVAGAIRAAAQHLEAESDVSTSEYAYRAAEAVDRWGTSLDQKSLGELVDDIQRTAREQPALAAGLAALAGFVGTRFMRSSERAEKIDVDVEVEEPVAYSEPWLPEEV